MPGRKYSAWLERVMNSAEKPHQDADLTRLELGPRWVSRFLRIRKLFLSKFITAYRERLATRSLYLDALRLR
jgi:hypothetical protein